jgi:hypothetical protein
MSTIPLIGQQDSLGTFRPCMYRTVPRIIQQQFVNISALRPEISMITQCIIAQYLREVQKLPDFHRTLHSAVLPIFCNSTQLKTTSPHPIASHPYMDNIVRGVINNVHT